MTDQDKAKVIRRLLTLAGYKLPLSLLDHLQVKYWLLLDKDGDHDWLRQHNIIKWRRATK